MKFFIFLLLLSATIFGDDLTQQLSKDSYWLKLLHYHKHKSTIKTTSFFLSPNGSSNPASELIATLKAFSKSDKAICKYPARYRWLDSQLDFKKSVDLKRCPKLQIFLKPDFRSLDVVFTAQRYNSPASVFGHTFIKLETKTYPFALNYSAKIPKGVNSFSYAYGGLTGKFKSGYKLAPFSLKDYEYRTEEFRDLIYFRLNLTKDDLRNILLHLYEIKDTKEDYYFINHNCSSELLKLIDMAKYHSGMDKELSTLVIPTDVLYILKKYGYIGKITKQKSKLKIFYNTISKLNSKEKNILFNIVHIKQPVYEFDSDKSIDKERKFLIIKSAIEYFQMKSLTDGLSQKELYPYMKLIKLDIQYNIATDDTVDSLKTIPILNRFHKLYTGVFSTSDKKGTIFGYRELYRDRFDMIDAKTNGSVDLLDIALRDYNNHIDLQYLTIANLEAMPISNRFFKESTNRIKLGFKRVFKEDKLYTYLDYSIGYRYAISGDITYLYGIKLGGYYNKSLSLLASPQSAIEYNHNNKIASELKFSLDAYTNGKTVNNIEFSNYIKIGKYSNINLSYKHKSLDVFSAIYSFMF